MWIIIIWSYVTHPPCYKITRSDKIWNWYFKRTQVGLPPYMTTLQTSTTVCTTVHIYTSVHSRCWDKNNYDRNKMSSETSPLNGKTRREQFLLKFWLVLMTIFHHRWHSTSSLWRKPGMPPVTTTLAPRVFSVFSDYTYSIPQNMHTVLLCLVLSWYIMSYLWFYLLYSPMFLVRFPRRQWCNPAGYGWNRHDEHIFHTAGPLVGKSIGHRWIQWILTKDQ